MGVRPRAHLDGAREQPECRAMALRVPRLVQQAGVDRGALGRGPGGMRGLRLVGKVGRLADGPTDGQSLLEWHPQSTEESRGELRLGRRRRNPRGEILCWLFAEPAEAVTVQQPPVDELGCP